MKKIMHLWKGLVLLIFLSGCATTLPAGYSKTRFNTSVQEVYNAVLATLRDENLPFFRKALSADEAAIESQFADGKHVWIDMQSISYIYTLVSLRIEDEETNDRALDLMRKIESHIDRTEGKAKGIPSADTENKTRMNGENP